MKKYRILDWYVHQGHQYEFFKTGHDFFLVAANGKRPVWNSDHRPMPKNLHLISEERAKSLDFDIVIIRTPIPSKRYLPFIHKGAAPIAVIQTVHPIWLPREIKHVVWNSHEAMRKKLSFYRNRHQHFIIHGFDPEEFKQIEAEKNNRILTVANHFKKRGHIMGYDIWDYIKKRVPRCDVIGSKNEDIPGSIDHKKTMVELLEAYNKYSIYLNPTRESAMPRSRAEAAMCGMPIVSTMHFDVKRFFRPGKDAILSNDKRLLASELNRMLESKQMRIDYGMAAREVAIKHFHIDDYLSKWNTLFDRVYNE